mmetsp:Transcript_37279/g.73896  ORF Transcript_37279/g.73896 Transcript_37279/m.73896 type:complete len:150 (+) Transcript_37279:888-1337(+)
MTSLTSMLCARRLHTQIALASHALRLPTTFIEFSFTASLHLVLAQKELCMLAMHRRLPMSASAVATCLSALVGATTPSSNGLWCERVVSVCPPAGAAAGDRRQEDERMRSSLMQDNLHVKSVRRWQGISAEGPHKNHAKTGQPEDSRKE